MEKWEWAEKSAGHCRVLQSDRAAELSWTPPVSQDFISVPSDFATKTAQLCYLAREEVPLHRSLYIRRALGLASTLERTILQNGFVKK